jgi:hypothetical protein
MGPAATRRNAAVLNRISWRSQPSTVALHVQLADEARAFDQPAPRLVPTVLATNGPAGRQRTVISPVGLQPTRLQHLRLVARPDPTRELRWPFAF